MDIVRRPQYLLTPVFIKELNAVMALSGSLKRSLGMAKPIEENDHRQGLRP